MVNEGSEGRGGDAEHFSRLFEWLNTNADRLLDDPATNLVAVGIGITLGVPLGLAAAVRGELGLTSLPLLMVTAIPDHAQALAGGVDKVMAKPFTSATLVGAVEELLTAAGRASA